MVGGALIAPAAHASATFAFGRLAGTDRYDTARFGAEAAFPSGASTVLLANGSLAHFPDALTGSYLAGFLKAPVLLTDVSTVPAATNQALQELHTTTIVVLGGTAAVSQAEYDQLATHYKMARVAGPSRYDTMKAVAEGPPAGGVGSTSGGPTAVLASGVNFPDALVAGPIGYAKSFPVLITDPSSLSSQTSQTLKDLGIKFVLIPGGTAAVSSTVESQVQAMGITTQSFSGADRTDTAAQVATYAVQSLGFTNTRVDLARGDDPADSLSGGPYGGVNLTPTLLTNNPNTLGTSSAQYLTSNAPTLASGAIFGGTSAVSQAVQDQATRDAQATGTVPKLASASLSGTTLSLTYNEAVVCSTVDSNGSDYQVTVGTTADTPTAAACSGPSAQGTSTTVSVTLPTAPAANQTVTVTVQNGTDGNTVSEPAGLAEPVGDSITTSSPLIPKFTAASIAVGTTTLAVGYNEPVVCSSVQPTDFAVTAGSAADTVNAASCQGTAAQSVSLTIASAPTSGQTVTVTAQKGSDGDTVADQSGQTQPVGDSVSTPATVTQVPSLLTVGAGGGSSTVTLTYNEAITCSSLDSNGSDYTVKDTPPGGAGAADNPTAASCSTPSNGASNTVRLTVPTAPQTGDTVTVTAKNGGDGNTVVDSALVPEAVGDTQSTTALGPQFTSLSATAGSTAVTVTYNESLNCSSVDPGDYTVSDAGSTDLLTAPPACSNNKVTLTVANAPKGGDEVMVTAAKGVDQNTVLDNPGYAQKAGDSIKGSAQSTPTMTGVTATAQLKTVTVSYEESIQCSSVDADGSDYSVTDAPSGGSAAADSPTAASCANPTNGASSSVAITVTTAPAGGDTVTVTAKNGADGNTVLGFNNGQEPVGDSKSTTVGKVPVFQSASATPGTSTVTVTYNENTLNCTTVDTNGSDYTVTVGGTDDPVTAASCSPPFGPSVTITLKNAIPSGSSGQPVTVTARAGADGDTVKDLSGAAQPGGDSISTNQTGTVAPSLVKVTEQNNSIFTVTFNEAVNSGTCDKGDFAVTYSNTSSLPPVSNQPVTVKSLTCDNNGSYTPSGGTTQTGVGEATITLAQSVPGSSTVTVTAQKGSDTNTVCASGSTTTCEATGDSATSPSTTDKPPTFQGMTATNDVSKGAQILLTYNEAILCSTVDSGATPPIDYKVQYTPTAGGSTTTYPSNVWSAQCVQASGGYSYQVQLSDSSAGGGPFTTGYTIDVFAQTGHDMDTVCTNPAPALPPGSPNCQAVGDHASATTPPGPVMSSASATTNGPTTATLVITYSEAIQCGSVDANGSDYNVAVGSGPATQALTASCSPAGGSSTTVTITWMGTVVPGSSKVCAQNGVDNNTVLAASDGTPEAVGDCKTF